MKRLRAQYRYYSQRKKQSAVDASFPQAFPQKAENWQTRSYSGNQKPLHTFSHWLMIIIFGAMMLMSVSTHLLLILGFTAIAALVKGPGMLLFGMIYSFLISFLPILALPLALIFFFLSLYQFKRNWRFVLAALFFYLYPVLFKLAVHGDLLEQQALYFTAIAFGLIGLHVLLINFYRECPNSKACAWSMLTVPYDCLVFLIPSKKRRKLATKRN